MFQAVFTCFSPCLGIGCGGGGGGGKGLVHNLLMQFSPGQLKNRSFRNLFLITERPSKIFRVCFKPYLCVFHLIWVLGAGGGGGYKRDWYTTCLCTFSSLFSSKIEVSETYFFDIVIT